MHPGVCEFNLCDLHCACFAIALTASILVWVLCHTANCMPEDHCLQAAFNAVLCILTCPVPVGLCSLCDFQCGGHGMWASAGSTSVTRASRGPHAMPVTVASSALCTPLNFTLFLLCTLEIRQCFGDVRVPCGCCMNR